MSKNPHFRRSISHINLDFDKQCPLYLDEQWARCTQELENTHGVPDTFGGSSTEKFVIHKPFSAYMTTSRIACIC